MSLKDITITGSIGSIATQSYGQRTYISSTDEQSFPIEHITGSDAKVWPNFVQGENYTVNLIVNVTQSWSGSNVTPLGDVPYVHNTMEEFIDGEFSGSNYVVTDGNLNDAQCEQFLTVNTTLVEYSIFSYFQNFVPNPTNAFLNANTIPRNGEILILYNNYSGGNTYGVYAKIARIDSLGNDNTLSLQELNQFNYVDSVAGKIIFNIINRTEYTDYYLYQVTTDNIPVVPADYNILDYSFSASSAITASSATNNLIYLDQWTVYNSGSGYWDNYANFSFALTPNVITSYTASIDVYNPIGGLFGQSVTFGFWENNYAGNVTFYTPVQTIKKTFDPGDTINITLSGSYTFVGSQDIQYHLEIITGDYNYPVSLSNTFWIMTQSQNPVTIYTSSTIIEPYLLSNFNNSDCDVFMNNAFQNDESGLYRRVLYDGESGSLVPSNFEQIISGTAEYAQVNDYLFNAKANTLPRYEGSRVEQKILNKWTLGDVGPSLTPSVQFLKTSVAYSTTIIDQAPIKMNASKAIVKYYIDETGNTITPNVDKTSIYTAQGNFSNNTGFSIDPLASNTENLIINFPLQGTTLPTQYKPIIRGGSRLEPILYNQIKDYSHPPMTWASDLNFTDNNALSSTTFNDFTVTLFQTSSGVSILRQSIPSGIALGGVASRGANITDELITNNSYKVTSSVFLAEGFDLVLYAQIELLNTSGDISMGYTGTSFPLTVSIMRTRGGSTDRFYASINTTIPPWYYDPQSRYYTVIIQKTVPYSEIQVDDIFNIGLCSNIPSYGPSQLFSTNNTFFKILTNPLPTPPISTIGLFQTTSLAPQSIFTTSSQLINYYNNPSVLQVDITGSLFPPVTLPFTLQTGDEFRFDGDETRTFMVKYATILDSGSSPLFLSTSSLYIEFTNQISGSDIDVNQFLLRRYVDDAESIIFENYGDKRMTGSIVLSPEYTIPQLQNNINKYIEDLTQKGLI